jgi:tRNA(Ile)-lysidine synthase
MDLLSQFQQQLSKYHLLHSKQQVLIAVSGGLDSIVLTDLAFKSSINFSISHCNFQLRAEESSRDEQFARELAAKYNCPLFIRAFDTKTFAAANKLSIQEAARKLRYDYFEELRKEHSFSYTFVAHHANDRIETLLMNFFRGTGLEGLTGMPQYNKDQAHTLRPLLSFKREDITKYALENNLSWVEDSSNESSKYTRNYFRNELLPQIKKVYPAVEDNLLNNIERFTKTANLYNEVVGELKQHICVKKGSEVHIPILKLVHYTGTSLLYEIIKDYGFSEKQVEEINKLTSADSGKYVSNENWQVIRHRRWLIIAPVMHPSSTLVIDEISETVTYPEGILHITKKNAAKVKVNNNPLVAQLDAREIEWPLVLRKFRQGDYFYPLGMRKKKKLSRFFIDTKLSKADKENVWVLESNSRILWVVGLRIDDRFKITGKTKQALEISVSNL